MYKELKFRIIREHGSQANFAMAVREDESTISRVIHGRRSLPANKREKWAEALKCKPQELFR